MSKRKQISYDKCDDLEWIVDIFGTVQLLASIISSESPSKDFIIADMSDNEITDSEGNTLKVGRINRGDVKQGKGPPGLYFNGAHWYCLKNGKTTDSYQLGYQMDQTAHFCQTFALIIFLGKDKTGKYKMIKQDYGKNIYTALQFWKDIFINPEYSELTKFVINEIKMWNLTTGGELNSKNVSLPNDGTILYKITKQKLINFIEYLQIYALQNVYNGCSEG